jgi:hypothetical protein
MLGNVNSLLSRLETRCTGTMTDPLITGSDSQMVRAAACAACAAFWYTRTTRAVSNTIIMTLPCKKTESDWLEIAQV